MEEPIPQGILAPPLSSEIHWGWAIWTLTRRKLHRKCENVGIVNSSGIWGLSCLYFRFPSTVKWTQYSSGLSFPHAKVSGGKCRANLSLQNAEFLSCSLQFVFWTQWLRVYYVIELVSLLGKKSWVYFCFPCLSLIIYPIVQTYEVLIFFLSNAK